ncbi:MAG: DUF1461 domain-containing protein [Chloroflexota bacterium]|nr:DUF1461 domain-containing protein [Chloroflexota bacterium]
MLLGLVFAVAAGLAILLTGPLLLFNPWLVGIEQGRQGVADSLGTTQAEVDRLTGQMLGDLFFNGDFSVSLDGEVPILEPGERSHMRDVGGVVRGLVLLEGGALVVLVLTGLRLRRERSRRGRLVIGGAALIGVAAMALGLFFALDFDTAFAAFHALFFAAGTWQFSADSNLIRLFPQPLWFDAALLAGVTIVVGAVTAALLARRDLRAATD